MSTEYAVEYLLLQGLFVLLAVTTLAGMLWRRRAAACFGFQVFLLFQFIVALPILIDASTWWNWRWVLATDAAEATLFVVVAVELVSKALRPMPPGFRHVSRLFATILGITALVLVGQVAPLWATEAAFDPALARALIGGSIYGAAFLFVTFIGAVSYARVPIDPVHRDIAGGLALWGLLVAVRAITGRGYVLMAIGLNAVLAYWAYKAWRPEEPTELPREALEVCQPWRLERVSR